MLWTNIDKDSAKMYSEADFENRLNFLEFKSVLDKKSLKVFRVWIWINFRKSTLDEFFGIQQLCKLHA